MLCEVVELIGPAGGPSASMRVWSSTTVTVRFDGPDDSCSTRFPALCEVVELIGPGADTRRRLDSELSVKSESFRVLGCFNAG